MTDHTPRLEMFLAVCTGLILIWWKLRRTLNYIAKNPPRVILPPRPRPAPRKVEPVADISWREFLADSGVAPTAYRDDTQAAA